MEKVWQTFATNLKFARSAYKLQVFAFVLMNNHFHLIVRAPEGNLSEAMAWVIGSTSLHLGHDLNRINQIFARRFKKCLLADPRYFLNCYKYVYQNPIRAKICDRVEQYPYSTLRGHLGLGPLLIETDDDTLMNDIEGTLAWLNRTPADIDNKSMKVALRRLKFRLPRTVGGNKINPLESSYL